MADDGEPIITLALPEGTPIADVAVAMFVAMAQQGLTEARAECPYCARGWLHAGRFGNARRAKVECDSCGRIIVESFRSALKM